MSVSRQTMSWPWLRLNRGRSRALLPAAATSKKRGECMVSPWWVIAASWIGCYAGVLAMVLMQTYGSVPEQSTQARDPNRLP
jgi:hypothetical protein